MAHPTSSSLDRWPPNHVTRRSDDCSAANDSRRPHRSNLPGVRRLRAALLVFVLFASTGAGGHAPPWTRVVLAVTAVAIPAAIAVQYGWPAVRTLLGLPSRLRLRGGSVPAPHPTQPE
ncbi:hypothetical protein ACQEUX_04085 [Micromonospora sp. CA-259024]|uniref:hypothetical protein n=1 Tax=Micromonospora sp. CA-259024 TaxID=3239965 RepID=UPI003D8F5438